MKVYKFGIYLFNPKSRTIAIVSNDETTERQIKLSSAEAALLLIFLFSPDKNFTREELQNLGWEGRPVGTNSLPVAITALRKHLSECPDIEIITVPRKGYYLRLDMPLEEISLTQKKSEDGYDEKQLNKHKHRNPHFVEYKNHKKIIKSTLLIATVTTLCFFNFSLFSGAENFNQVDRNGALIYFNKNFTGSLPEVKAGSVLVFSGHKIILEQQADN